MTKNYQKWTKSPISQFPSVRKNHESDFIKNPTPPTFSIRFGWSFQDVLEMDICTYFRHVYFDWRLRKNLAVKFREMCAQMPKNFRGTNWEIKTISETCHFQHILKISAKSDEKCRRSRVLNEITFAILANWDNGDFVHFWQFFWPRTHILAAIGL